MAIRPNNLGQEGKHKWGILGKRKTYTNEAFKVIETEKKKPYDWSKKLKPWSAMDKGYLTVMMPGQVTGPPPPPEGEIWNTSTDVWNTTTDEWNNI